MYPYQRVNIFIVPCFSMMCVLFKNDGNIYATEQAVIHFHSLTL
jgi:hypothetical protein